MRLIFVMDILNDAVVHGVRGERHKYLPISSYSKICNNSDPLDVLNAIRPGYLYIADLNAVQRKGDNFKTIEKIYGRIKEKSELMVDSGISTLEEALKVLAFADYLVAGTETCPFDVIKTISKKIDSEKLIVSMDMKDGSVLSVDKSIAENPLKALELMNSLELNGIIMLNLSSVGTKKGADVEFIRALTEASAHKVYVGGGISSLKDVHILKKSGVYGILTATAVHDGIISLEYVRNGTL